MSNEQKQHEPSAYAAAGVSIAEGDKAISLMKSAVKSTYDSRVLAGIGAFGGMMDASALKNMDSPVLVASTDGVGTKTMVAQRMNRWNTVGADLVNHSINDILVQGASPLFFMDYVAAAKLDALRVAEIVTGMAVACRETGCVLLGGETAEMPGVYHDGHWDIAGTIVGCVDKAKALDGSQIAVGDALIALQASGLHTNGYSLARHVLNRFDWEASVADLIKTQAFGIDLKLTVTQSAEATQSIGDLLLAVHRPYLAQHKALQAAGVAVHGMAHITGGGITDNVPRVLPENVSVVFKDRTWHQPLIFALIEQIGKIARAEMLQVFNDGLGMVIAIPAHQVDTALAALGTHVNGLPEATRVGEVVAFDAAQPRVGIVGVNIA